MDLLLPFGHLPIAFLRHQKGSGPLPTGDNRVQYVDVPILHDPLSLINLRTPIGNHEASPHHRLPYPLAVDEEKGESTTPPCGLVGRKR